MKKKLLRFVVFIGLSREGSGGSRQQSTVSVLLEQMSTASCLQGGNTMHVQGLSYSSSQLSNYREMAMGSKVSLLAEILSRQAGVGMH